MSEGTLPGQWDGIQFVARHFGHWRGAKRAHSSQGSVTDEQRSQRAKAPQGTVFHPAVRVASPEGGYW